MAAVSALMDEAPGDDCLRATKLVPAGVAASRENFAPAACDGAAKAFRYDRKAKVARVLRDVQPGEVLQPLSSFVLPAVAPGAPLKLRAAVGPVRVERDIVALQAAEPGERLFVRAADGTVFSVKLLEARP